MAEALGITNGSAEGGTAGWTTTAGTLEAHDPTAHYIMPVAGSYCFRGAGYPDVHAEQTITLNTAQKNYLTNGKGTLSLDWFQSSWGGYDQTEIIVQALDAADVVLLETSYGLVQAYSGYVNNPAQTPPANQSSEWLPCRLFTYLPKTTEKIKIKMQFHRRSGSNSDGYIDGMTGTISEDTSNEDIMHSSRNWQRGFGVMSNASGVIGINTPSGLSYPYNASYDRSLLCSAHRSGPVTTATGRKKLTIDYDNTTVADDRLHDSAVFEVLWFDADGLPISVEETEALTTWAVEQTALRSIGCPLNAVRAVIRFKAKHWDGANASFWLHSLLFADDVAAPGADPENYLIATGQTMRLWAKQAAVPPSPIGSAYAASADEAAVYVDNTNDFVSGGSFNSCMFQSHADHMYGLLYLIPMEYDFKDIQSEVHYQYHLWNAYRYSPVSLTDKVFDITAGYQSQTANGGGVDFIAQALPQTIAPLQNFTFEAIALVTGPTKLKAKLDHVFAVPGKDLPGQTLSGSVTKSLMLAGERGNIMPIGHNWAAELQVNYSFKTEIIKSWSGKEQRRAARVNPRRELEIDGWIAPEEFHFLMSKGQSAVLVPECTGGIAATVAGNTLTMAADAGWLQVGAVLMLGQKCCQAQLISSSIVSVDRTGAQPVVVIGATLVETEINVYPGMSGRVDDSSVKFATSQNGTGSVTINETPGTWKYQPKALPARAANAERQHSGVFYNGTEIIMIEGLEVFDWCPEWSGGVKGTFKPNRHDVDFGRGTIQHNQPERPEVTLKYRYLQHNAFAPILDFFLRMKGRRGTFLLPSGLHELEVTNPLPDGTAVIETANPLDYGQFGVPFGVALKKNGVWCHSKIDHVDGSNLHLVGSIEGDFTAPDKVSYLYRARLAGDKLGVSYKTDTVTEMNFGVRLL